MSVFVHCIVFLVSIGVIWYFAGSLVDAVSRIAKRHCGSGFFTAFFVLGFLTSVSEFSVALNAGMKGVPGVSAGNLIGASVVLLLFVVPVLALAGRGIRMNEGMPGRTLLLTLFAILLPALLVMDGNVTRTEGALALLVYGTVAYALYRSRIPIRTCEAPGGTFVERTRSVAAEGARIVVGAVAIFFAARFLVEEAVYVSGESCRRTFVDAIVAPTAGATIAAASTKRTSEATPSRRGCGPSSRCRSSAAIHERAMMPRPVSATHEKDHGPRLAAKWPSTVIATYTIQSRRRVASRTAVSAA